MNAEAENSARLEALEKVASALAESGSALIEARAKRNVELVDINADMLAALQGAMVIIDTIPWPQGMTEKLEEALVKRREAIIAAIRKAESTS